MSGCLKAWLYLLCWSTTYVVDQHIEFNQDSRHPNIVWNLFGDRHQNLMRLRCAIVHMRIVLLRIVLKDWPSAVDSGQGQQSVWSAQGWPKCAPPYMQQGDVCAPSYIQWEISVWFMLMTLGGGKKTHHSAVTGPLCSASAAPSSSLLLPDSCFKPICLILPPSSLS